MKKKDWEKWVDDLMGEKLYEGSTDFTATHIKDFISQLLKEQRKSYLKEFIKWYNSEDNELVEDAIERILDK